MLHFGVVDALLLRLLQGDDFLLGALPKCNVLFASRPDFLALVREVGLCIVADRSMSAL